MLKPQWQLGDDRFGVRDGVDRDVIALKGFDEGFGHSVGLRAADRCRARLHPNIQQQRFRVCRNKARSIVGQPFDGLRKDIDAAETVFDRRYDKVLNISSLLMPSVVATWAMASRSQQSSAKATRTFSLLSQPISKPSEHQRKFD